MTERPIIFSENIPRILDGTKTQTRRTRGLKEINKSPDSWCYDGTNIYGLHLFRRTDADFLESPDDCIAAIRCPYGTAGDRLWVRETWALGRATFDPHHGPCSSPIRGGSRMPVIYRANKLANDDDWRWRSSMFMPRWASRIDLENLSILPERLQSITEEDARAEGIQRQLLPDLVGNRFHWGDDTKDRMPTAHDAFRVLWDSINAKRGYPWAGNPWVWRIEYRRIKP